MPKSVNPLSKYINKLPAPFRNRAFLAIAAFLFFMVFVDKHNILTQFKLQKAVNQLEAEKIYYEDKIIETKQQRADFEKNKEKFAREKYFVKKSKEEVFVIEEH